MRNEAVPSHFLRHCSASDAVGSLTMRHVRTQQLPEPAGQIGLFEGQALVRRGNGPHVRQEFIGLGGDVPEAALPAVIVELGEHAILRVSIQPQPCYG